MFRYFLTVSQLIRNSSGTPLKKQGTENRAKFDADSLAFRLGIMLQEARKEAKLTQEDLAKKTGTKKSYISRIENGKSDIQLSTFYRIIELGIGKSLNICIG